MQIRGAFTLIELLIVIAIIAILASILMPVLAAAQRKAVQAQCINNNKELAIGWQLYATDNQDYMVPNSPFGSQAYQSWCPNGNNPGAAMDWGIKVGNTNIAVFTNTILAPYMSGQLKVYKCPADIWPSKDGIRTRDYSMQGQVGNLYCKGSVSPASGTLGENPHGVPYVKLTELHSAPGPSDVIVFLEEHPNSMLNSVPDGYLEVDSSGGTFPDVPGSNHKGWLGGMDFADGHAEMHKWMKPGIVNASLISTLQIPVSPNGPTISASPAIVSEGVTGVDWVWFTSHCSARQ